MATGLNFYGMNSRISSNSSRSLCFSIAAWFRPLQFTNSLSIAPIIFCDLVNETSARIDGIRQLRATVRCFGKANSGPKLGDIRAIIPLPVIASCIDFLLAARLHHFCDRVFPDIPGVFVGALKKTQTNDVSFSIQLAIERFLDNHSQGCIGQCDIRAFFDSIPATKIVNDLLFRSFDVARVCPAPF